VVVVLLSIKEQRADEDSQLSAGQEMKRSMVSGHEFSSYDQVADSSLNVSI
jgi:hypothetical protein